MKRKENIQGMGPKNPRKENSQGKGPKNPRKENSQGMGPKNPRKENSQGSGPQNRGEEKTVRVGTLAVEVEKMKSELFEAEKSLLADKESASKSTGSCVTQASEWEERHRHRAKSRGTTRSTAGHEELHGEHGDQSIERVKRERKSSGMRGRERRSPRRV